MMRKAVYVLAILVGVAAIFGGPLLGLTVNLLARSTSAGTESASENAIGLALAVVGVGCGGSLAWIGIRALRETPGRPLRLPGWLWWLVSGLMILAIGQAATGWRGPSALVLPVLHVASAIVAAMLFLSLATGAARSRGAYVGGRPAIGSLDWGALGGVTIGMFLELLLVVILVIVGALWLSVAYPDLAQQLQGWAMRMLQSPGEPPDLSVLRPLLSSPVLVLAGLSVVGIAIPIIEEGAKSLAVPIVMLTIHRRNAEAEAPVNPPAGAMSAPRMTRLDGFLFGVAAGAGFALVEGMLNGSLALVNPGSWGALMAVRGGTAALHCLATGLAGLGWQAGLAERRWGRAILFWLAAVALHGAWNVAAGISGLAGISGGQAGGAGPLANAARLLPLGLMGLLWISVVVALPLIAGYLAAQQAQTASAPAAAGAPGSIVEGP
jgi:RsiW-degrading membrane proteinase PrsW (M82 family)